MSERMTPERKRLVESLAWYRERANWHVSSHRRMACSEYTPLGRSKNLDCANCAGCGHLCHRPTDRERELWRRLADEIAAYLDEGDEGQEALAL